MYRVKGEAARTADATTGRALIPSLTGGTEPMSKVQELQRRVEDLETWKAAMEEALRRMGAATGIPLLPESAPEPLSGVGVTGC